MASSAEGDVQLLYCKHYDVESLRGDIADHLCTAVNKVAPWEARGAQKMRSAWIICVKTPNAKDILLQKKHSDRCNHSEIIWLQPICQKPFTFQE